MLGLSQVGPYMDDRPTLTTDIVDGWTGIFKWSVFFFSARIEGLERGNPSRLDVLSACWYSLAHRDAIREAMILTPATVEIATRLWLEEDSGPLPSILDAPMGTCVLGNILKLATRDQLNRVLRMANGKADEIAKLAISRLRNASKAPKVNPIHLSMYLDMINSLSRVPDHPLRYALLGANVIWVLHTFYAQFPSS
ncbi:uncharacterized protein FIBRA_00947 [Fibroporia radiculosa]|uniref:Uncharacterized protein n=1 Tax=Fibroporia radiculosa TaxID=599839 RepID=J4GJ01_9APHY|nr:uncharacterized protein FIBRA_00947 [Fibroporia radiculosa]CCL98940.1 predicted protein [Fibroporia radiculosa]